MSTVISPAPRTQYNVVAMSLHWLIAVMIIGLLVAGFVMKDMAFDNPLKFKLYQLHKSFGITVLALSIIRLIWRLLHKAPSLPEGTKKWARATAGFVHTMLYILTLGLPLVGWLGVSTSPWKIPTVIFGWFTLPDLPFFQDQANASELFELHEAMALGLIALLVLHIGAAMLHHFFKRDEIMLRMTPKFLHDIVRRLRGQKLPPPIK